MELDDELCLCFHVTKRKVVNFIRITQPRRASQLSECYGAGTGCGWCRKYMQHLFEQYQAGTLGNPVDEPSAQEHAQGRSRYVRQGQGTPPPDAC